jgi:hypothetical protein
MTTDERRPDGGGTRSAVGGTSSSLGTLPPPTDELPQSRPWAQRPDAHTVELRFRRDRAGWRRRIDCARRLTHDARDELAAPAGRWTP